MEGSLWSWKEAFNHGTEPCLVTERRRDCEKMKDSTSQPDVGPRGSPAPLKCDGAGLGLVMEQGLVQSRKEACSHGAGPRVTERSLQ